MICRPSYEPPNENENIEFQILDWFGGDCPWGGGDAGQLVDGIDKFYGINIFGVTEKGNSIGVRITGFHPYFFIELPTEKNAQQHAGEIVTMLRRRVHPRLKKTLLRHSVVHKKKLVGYTAKKEFPFLMLTFWSQKGMREYLEKLEDPIKLNGVKRRLRPWESNLAPMLRFMHVADLRASGWALLPHNKYQHVEDENDIACQIAVSIEHNDIKPLPREKMAPFVIASYDIESDSSHGDFPQAKKDYRKLALELQTVASDRKDLRGDVLLEHLQWAFGEGGPGISPMFTKNKRKPRDEALRQLVQQIDSLRLLDDSAQFRQARRDHVKLSFTSGKTMDHFFSKETDSDQYDANPSQLMRAGEKPKDARERLIKDLVDVLGLHLPPLKGDQVIQIGTTVTKFGHPDFSYKHIVTLDTADAIEGAVVESCKTESDVIKQWIKKMKELDADIVTGWNLFNFDDKFLWDRAEELEMTKEFAALERITGLTPNLEEKTLSSSALGDNKFYFIRMRGRVNIDLMKSIQGNVSFKLDSYKLDNVAATFMRGAISAVSTLDGGGTRITTKGTEGLIENGFVSFVVHDGILENPALGGAKCQVTNLTASSFDIREDLRVSAGCKASWCEAKDDMPVKQIFAAQKGTSADRSLVARYCLQDTTLVGRLFSKLDILTTAQAMSNTCHVPLSYLFLRGQGVKVFSLVARQTRLDGYLVPLPGKVLNDAVEIQGGAEDDDEDGGEKESVREGYEGAIVLPPIADIHYDPVAVNDFASREQRDCLLPL